MKTLYQRLTEAGIEVWNHESDLLFPANDQTRAIVKDCLIDGVLHSKPELFRSEANGKLMFEAPFQFDLYWQKLIGKKVKK